jgi:hypothetical protein
MLKAHVQRMIDERDALAEKLEKLAEFIDRSDVFTSLDIGRKLLLVQQRSVMYSYKIILDQRIRMDLDIGGSDNA